LIVSSSITITTVLLKWRK